MKNQPFSGMCEVCESRPALCNDFVCEECLLDMLNDMDIEEQEKSEKTCDNCHLQPAMQDDVLCEQCSDELCINSL